MIEEASVGRIYSWSVELGDGDLALVPYTLDIDAAAPLPDFEALDNRLNAMVRGWEPSVEEALGALVGPARATRLALSILDDFPEPYRTRTDAHEAAQDVLRVCELDGAAARDARLYRKDRSEERRVGKEGGRPGRSR